MLRWSPATVSTDRSADTLSWIRNRPLGKVAA